MEYLVLVTGLVLLQYVAFGIAVGNARARYDVKAPAVTGNDIFERYFRVQQNTLELIVVLLPALWMFAEYVSANWAALLGLVYFAGRIVYFRSYVANPASRSAGFGLSVLPVLVLVIGAMLGACSMLLRS
jgi:uncharacterized MAPEG superfamily protein